MRPVLDYFMADESPEQPRSTDPDAPLVKRAVAGEYAAFEQLVARYERPLYTLAMRILRNAADAQETVQETLLSVVEHLADFAGQSTFYTWMMRIATNQALQMLRRRKGAKIESLTSSNDDFGPIPHPDFIADWRDNPEDLAQRNESQAILTEALESLDEKYRLVFILRDVQGLSIEETAEALGIGLSNVKVRLLRARLMLREKLTQHFGDPNRRIIKKYKHAAEVKPPESAL